MDYHEDREDEIQRATDVLSRHYLGAMECTPNNVRYSVRQAIWDQLVYATAAGFDPGELVQEILTLCERLAPESPENQ